MWMDNLLKTHFQRRFVPILGIDIENLTFPSFQHWILLIGSRVFKRKNLSTSFISFKKSITYIHNFTFCPQIHVINTYTFYIYKKKI